MADAAAALDCIYNPVLPGAIAPKVVKSVIISAAFNKNDLLDDIIDERMCDLGSFYDELENDLDEKTKEILEIVKDINPSSSFKSTTFAIILL